MTSDPRMPNLNDETLFDLLEHPEQWPDDPVLQAQLAEMLELHLGLRAHVDDLDVALLGEPRRAWWRSGLLSTAAAVLLVVLPTLYAFQHSRYQAEQRKSVEHHERVAQRRGQDRLWSGFLDQSRDLLRNFDRNPPVCGTERTYEDRSAERQLALALKTRSQMLIGTGAPSPEAKILLGNLHDWLMELSLEDGCMTPERVQQLRQMAKANNLSDDVDRLSRSLAEAGPGGTP